MQLLQTGLDPVQQAIVPLDLLLQDCRQAVQKALVVQFHDFLRKGIVNWLRYLVLKLADELNYWVFAFAALPASLGSRLNRQYCLQNFVALRLEVRDVCIVVHTKYLWVVLVWQVFNVVSDLTGFLMHWTDVDAAL